MSTNQQTLNADAVGAVLTRFRQTALKQTTEILLNPATTDDAGHKAEAFPRLAAILASSLEELRVMEEELHEQAAALHERQQEAEQRLEYERRLFEMAPAALLVTDMAGTILDTNRAARMLLGADATNLERKPIATFIGETDRRSFRAELNRVAVTNGAADWRFRVSRRRDVPVLVTAVVDVVPRANCYGDGVGLFWCLRPLTEQPAVAHAPHDALSLVQPSATAN